MKPIETGVDSKCSSAANSDALFLMECGKLKDDLSKVSPIRLKSPASPYQAAKIENLSIQTETILSAYQALAEKHDWMLVEGLGGVRVPITRDYEVLDLIRDLGLPAVIVARYQVGTLNHTLLTVNALKQNDIPIKGIIFNQTGPEALDAIEQAQPQLIAELTEVPVLGEFPYIKKLDTHSFSPKQLNELKTSINFSELIQE